jgi:hypothetical protein
MRCSVLLLLAAFGVADAFVSKPSFARPCVAVALADVAEATETDEAAVVEWPAFEPSGLSMADIRKTISKISKDNFQASLDTIEPFLVNEAGSTIYGKSLRRLGAKAKDAGFELPASYAKEARCTKQRRDKQNTFIQEKEEERVAAEAAAAEEAAAAVAAAAEATSEEAPVAEATEEPAVVA